MGKNLEKKMSDLNVVALVGRLSRDAVIRAWAKGGIVCNFTPAVNRSRKREDGGWEEAPNFCTFAPYGDRAASLRGRLTMDRWESRGVRRARLDAAVDDPRFIGAAPGGAKATEGQSAETAEAESETDPDLDLGEIETTEEMRYEDQG
jgi:single-stranded DNA-binding protein